MLLGLCLVGLFVFILILALTAGPKEPEVEIRPGDLVRALPAWHLTTILPPEAVDIDPTVEGVVVSISKHELLVRMAGTPASDFRCYRTGAVLLERAK